MPATSAPSATPGRGRHRAADRLLQRVVESEIGIERQAVLATVGEHAAVLARAVVLQRAELRSCRRQFFARGVEQRRMHAALQLLRDTSGALEHVGDRRDLSRLAGMARAQQRDLLRRKAEVLDPAACDQAASACSGLSALRVVVR